MKKTKAGLRRPGVKLHNDTFWNKVRNLFPCVPATLEETLTPEEMEWLDVPSFVDNVTECNYFILRRLDDSEHAVIRDIGPFYAAHLLDDKKEGKGDNLGSLLPRILFHFSVADEEGNESHAVVCPTAAPRRLFRLRLGAYEGGELGGRGGDSDGDGDDAFLPRYDDLLEIGAAAKHSESHVLGGRAVAAPLRRRSMASKLRLAADAEASERADRRQGKRAAAESSLVVPTRPERRRFLAALQRDVAFLASRGLTGYTLLVGRRRRSSGAGSGSGGGTDTRVKMKKRGGAKALQQLREGSMLCLPGTTTTTTASASSGSSSSPPPSSSSENSVLDLALEGVFKKHKAGYAVAYAKKHKTTDGSSPESYRKAIVGRVERMTKALEDIEGAGSGGGGGGGGTDGMQLRGGAVERSAKVYDGSESVGELLDDAEALVKDDFPMLAVLALRRAREKVVAEEEDEEEEEEEEEGVGGSGEGGRGGVDKDPRAAAAAAVESELVALLEDIADEGRWRKHGTGRYGATVHVEKKNNNKNSNSNANANANAADSSSGTGAGGWFGRGGGSRMLRFKCEMVLDCKLFEAVAVMNEVDDFPMWMPQIDQSDTRSVSSMFRRVVRVSGGKPWPFERDELILVAYGDTLDARKLLGDESPLGSGVAIYLRPAPPEDFPRTPGCHPVDLTGGYWFEACGENGNKTRVINVATIDPHVMIPAWFLNFIIVNVAYLILPMLGWQSKHFAPGGKLRDRIDGKPEVYGEIQRRLDKLERNASGSAADASSTGGAGASAGAGAAEPLPIDEPIGGGRGGLLGFLLRALFRVGVRYPLAALRMGLPLAALVRCVSPHGGDVLGWARRCFAAPAALLHSAATAAESSFPFSSWYFSSSSSSSSAAEPSLASLPLPAVVGTLLAKLEAAQETHPVAYYSFVAALFNALLASWWCPPSGRRRSLVLLNILLANAVLAALLSVAASPDANAANAASAAGGGGNNSAAAGAAEAMGRWLLPSLSAEVTMTRSCAVGLVTALAFATFAS